MLICDYRSESRTIAENVGTNMKLKNNEVGLLQRTLKSRTLDRMAELSTSAAELARSTGLQKSTISDILSDKNRLPNLPTLLALSKALAMPVSAFLPDHFMHLEDEWHKDRRSFIEPKHLNIQEVVELIFRYGMKGDLYYHPRSIPEFTKPPEILAQEYSLGINAATAYHEKLLPIMTLGLRGVLAIDEQCLTDILDRKGQFAGITRQTSMAAIRLLQEFDDANANGTEIYICQKKFDLIDPILVMSESNAVADYLGSLLFLNDRSLINTAIERMQVIANRRPTLKEWLKDN
ncbi:MAG: helix-turn-helix transcriptional regulator [Marivivens sp.]|nr:helix-turn-helix transcriptional regulator [Marivivens sp.]